MSIRIRQAKPDDIAFIYATWLRCYKHDSPLTKYIHPDIFFVNHQRLLDNLLSQTSVKVVVACDDEEESLIFGFLAYEKNIIHFIYVKKAFRLMRVGTKLVSFAEIDLKGYQASHLTYQGIALSEAKQLGIVFNPYLLR